MGSYSRVKIDVKDHIGYLTLSRPEVLNAVDEEMHKELPKALLELDERDDVDVIVITGAGRSFCAGGDFYAFKRWLGQGMPAYIEVRKRALNLVSTLLSVEKITIAKVNGDAVGLGATIALACDFVIAREDARIGDTHIRAGLVAGDGGAVLWALAVGMLRAKDLLLRGKLITAREAESLGLVTKAVKPEELDSEVENLASEIINGPKMAIRWTKEVFNHLIKTIIDIVMPNAMALESMSMNLKDFEEAIQKFLSKSKKGKPFT